MSKITKLTAEQQALMPVWAEKWMRIGLSCDPLNEAAAKDAVCRAYAQAGLAAPQFIVCDSPLSGAITASILKNPKRVWDSVGDSVYGQHDAAWIAFLLFFNAV